MKLYLVQRVGVYIHETMGVYDNLQVAEERAAECALPPDDGYHRYRVSELDLNNPIDGAIIISSYQAEYGPYPDKLFLGVFKED